MPLKLSTRHDPLPTANGAAAPQARNRPGPVRPRTLIAARWIALAGQAAAVAGAWALGARFPLAPVALVMAAAVVMNLRLGTGPHRADDRHALAQLGFDTLQTGALLTLTGGIANPFALFVLAPLTIGASVLPLRHILAGKIIGNALLAIAQVTLLAAVALIGLSQTKWSAFVGTVAGASGWFLLFFLVGFFVVACMFAVAGALASRSEDVQSTSQPVVMLVVLVLVVGMSLSGTAQVVASYVPVVSTVTMPARIMDGSAAWWEPILAIGIAIVAAYVITRLATRLYERSIMRTGGRLSYREAFKLGA